MGRTGNFLGSQLLGIEPDYICLSKALGGGLVKIGALLIKRERFVDEFSMIHTSTFAEDELSCRVALKALEILDRDQLTQRCAEAGSYLLAGLNALKADFPEQVKEVRGAGLMLGLELRDHSDSPSNTFLMLSKQKYFGYAAAAYLLMVHNVRIAPTLSEPFTLRLEPSAYVTEESMDQGLGITAAQIMDSMQNGRSKWVLGKVREGVELAAEEGCTVVGLGGHTSIVSANGLHLRGCKPALTSGNALTVGMAIMAVRRAVKKLGICTQCASVAVVGATGNIGSTCAVILASEFGEVYLIGRSATTPRLVAVAEEIRAQLRGRKCIWATIRQSCATASGWALPSTVPMPRFFRNTWPPGPG